MGSRAVDFPTLIRCGVNEWLSQRLSGYGPVLDLQPCDTRKLIGIVSDEREIPCLGLPGDESVVWPDRRSLPLQLSPDFASHAGVFA